MGRLTRFLSTAALLVSVVWIGWYVRSNPAVVEVVRGVSVGHVGVLLGLILGIFATNGLFTRSILSAYGHDFSVREAALLAVTTTAANYVLPGRSGAGVRALYLKGRVGFSLVDFFATLSGLLIVGLCVNGSLGIISIVLLTLSGRPFDPYVAAVFITAVVGSAAAIAVPIEISAERRLLTRVLGGWKRIYQCPTLLGKVVAITLAQSALMLCQTWVAFHAVHVAAPLADTLFFTSAKSLALLATITPGAIGVVEWLSVYMAEHLAFSPDQAFAAQGLMRAITISAALSIGPLAAAVLGSPRYRRRLLGVD